MGGRRDEEIGDGGKERHGNTDVLAEQKKKKVMKKKSHQEEETLSCTMRLGG